AFAAVLIWLGVLGLTKGTFPPGWLPIPKVLPQQAMAWICSFICIACGAGLLWRRAAAPAARVLLAWLLLWLSIRVPWIAVQPDVGVWWSASSTAVMTASAWVVYSWVAGDWDRRHLGFFAGDNGVRVARTLFGLGLIPFGLAHFLYLEATAPLVPGWLPWH